MCLMHIYLWNTHISKLFWQPNFSLQVNALAIWLEPLYWHPKKAKAKKTVSSIIFCWRWRCWRRQRCYAKHEMLFLLIPKPMDYYAFFFFFFKQTNHEIQHEKREKKFRFRFRWEVLQRNILIFSMQQLILVVARKKNDEQRVEGGRKDETQEKKKRHGDSSCWLVLWFFFSHSLCLSALCNKFM